MDAENPWQVESIEAFYFLKCPQCLFFTQKDSSFYHHAVENHPLSLILFGKPTIEIINPLEILDLPVKSETPENSFEVNENSFEMKENSFEVNESSLEVDESSFDKTIAEDFNGKIKNDLLNESFEIIETNEQNRSELSLQERSESHGNLLQDEKKCIATSKTKILEMKYEITMYNATKDSSEKYNQDEILSEMPSRHCSDKNEENDVNTENLYELDKKDNPEEHTENKAPLWEKYGIKKATVRLHRLETTNYKDNKIMNEIRQ